MSPFGAWLAGMFVLPEAVQVKTHRLRDWLTAPYFHRHIVRDGQLQPPLYFLEKTAGYQCWLGHSGAYHFIVLQMQPKFLHFDLSDSLHKYPIQFTTFALRSTQL